MDELGEASQALYEVQISGAYKRRRLELKVGVEAGLCLKSLKEPEICSMWSWLVPVREAR
jgi:hypothetical protein